MTIEDCNKLGFAGNQIVFYEDRLHWLTLEKNTDFVSAEYFSGLGTLHSSADSSLLFTFLPSKFIFEVAILLEGYKTQMSKDQILTWKTSERLNNLIFDFLSTYSSWKDLGVQEAWKHLSKYKDRLLEAREQYLATS